MCMRVFRSGDIWTSGGLPVGIAVEAELKAGVDLIRDMRERHRRENGDYFDDGRNTGALVQNAANLALEAADREDRKIPTDFPIFAAAPTTRDKLARCGAFCAAEIDRLNRLEQAETARKKAAEAARNKPRRFQYLGGAGVYTPADETYRYVRASDGCCDTYSGMFPQWVFSDLKWIDAAPLN
jgi:hypothetical protein